MAKEKVFKDEPLKRHVLYIRESHLEYLRSLDNGSKYVRWLLDNDSGYQKYLKENNG